MTTTFFTYCPKCQSTNHEFTNQHRFHCLDCDFTYYHNTAAAVMILIKSGDKYLFTQRNLPPAKDKLDLPGGFVDPTENAQQAAVRELKEELNIVVAEQDLQLIDTQANDYLYADILYRTVDIVFTLSLPEDTVFKLQKEEIQNIRWLQADEISDNDIGFKSVKQVIKKFVR